MSAPRERNPVPNEFRDQYAGGSDYTDDVQAALNGTYEEQEELPPSLQSIADRRKRMHTG